MSHIATQVRVPQLGPYEILEKIGQGGQGTIYKGRHAHADDLVAIKVIPKEVVADPVLRLRFAQECQVSRQLDHPHLVRVLDYGLDGAKPYLVMEYIDGENLGERLQRDGRLPEAEAVELIVQVGRALEWAHERRLIHRDVKPDNILIDASGQAKLTDLGLAKNLEGEFNLTQPMSCLGTPNFMAPEQFEDAMHVDARCDLYSLAATLYMVVTGDLPFRARSPRALMAILKKKLANDIAAPRQRVPELSQRVSDAILRALRANRSERQASVREFIDALTAKAPRGGRAAAAPAPAPAAADQVAEHERRIAKRYASKRPMSCQPLERNPCMSWSGQVVNISETGLCLKLSRRFEPGAVLTYTLAGARHQRRSLVARVVWVEKLAKNHWQLGCVHDQPLSDFEVAELG